MRSLSLFSRHARHPTTPPPPSFSGGGGGETPPRRRLPKENVDPSSYSSPAHHDHGASPFRSPSSAAKPLSARNRLLPPRPPSSNPLKRKLDVSSAAAAAGQPHDSSAPAPDSGVQVRLRVSRTIPGIRCWGRWF